MLRVGDPPGEVERRLARLNTNEGIFMASLRYYPFAP
jgi:hypothetical protein